MDKKNLTFTNSEGEVFRLSSINPLEEEIIKQQVNKEWLASGRPMPEPPAIELKTAAGETQRMILTKREQADTPELQAAWDAYERANAELTGMFTMRFLSSCFLCVETDPDSFPMWKRRMKILKLEIPEDEADKFILFCNTWVIRSKEDIVGLLMACTKSIANVSEEAMMAAEARFQRAMEKAAANIGLAEGAGGG